MTRWLIRHPWWFVLAIAAQLSFAAAALAEVPALRAAEAAHAALTGLESTALRSTTSPVPVLAVRSAGVRVFSGQWTVSGADGFRATLEAQTDEGPWRPVTSLQADSTGALPFALWPLRLGAVTRVRLVWDDAGVRRTTDAVSDTVPAAAANAALIPFTDHVTGAWTFVPADTGLVWQVQRASRLDGPWANVAAVPLSGLAGLGMTDTQALAGSRYYFRLLVHDGVGVDSVGLDSVITLRAPALSSKHMTPQRIDYTWSVPDDGTYGLGLERSDGGGWVAEAALQVDADHQARYTVYPTQQGAHVIYRVRWFESDRLLRFGAPETTVVMPAQVDPLGGTFGANRITTHWNVGPIDSGFVLTIERSSDGVNFGGVGIYNTGNGPSLTFDDRSVLPSHTYRYRLSWVLGHSAEIVGVTRQAPRAGLARARPDRVCLSWFTSPYVSSLDAPGVRGVSATLERRLPSGTWSSLATIGSIPLPGLTTVDSLGYDDFGAVIGQPYEYRLTWSDLGDTLHSAVIAATVPAISAALYTVDSKPTGVTVRWQVAGDDPLYPMRVIRRESVSSVWDTLGMATDELPGIRVFVDHSMTPGHEYSYRLVWTQGGRFGLSPEEPVFAIGSTILLGRPSPNPSRGGFRVPFGLPDATPTRMGVYDLSGRERVAQTYSGPGTGLFILPTGHLEPGVYFVRLQGGRRQVTRRVVVAP